MQIGKSWNAWPQVSRTNETQLPMIKNLQGAGLTKNMTESKEPHSGIVNTHS
jgi:hypothetical protein